MTEAGQPVSARIVELQVRVAKLKAVIRHGREELAKAAAELKTLEAPACASPSGVEATHGR